MKTLAVLVALAASLTQAETPRGVSPAMQALVDEFSVPFEPFHFAGTIYYVGTKELGSFLIVTPAGNILLDSGMERTVPLIRANVEKLGFKFSDTRILINSHAHFDHAAGDRDVRDATGARVMIMSQDADEIRRGHPEFPLGWKPCPVDRVLHDRDTVTLGGVTLTAHLTPGHTKGCTTWTTAVVEGGSIKHVVLFGGFTINDGVKLLDTPGYPNMASDFARTFSVLKNLPCDIFGAQHSYFFDMEAKAARLKLGDANPFIDPAGCRTLIAGAETDYRKQLAEERSKRRPPR